jgi:uncharacterized 2Fe-2S/4Fe-4S cluster protein (DUF4445 family)
MLVSDAAKAAGVMMKLPCNSSGRCGRCGVMITAKNGKHEQVLACQTPINSDMIVTVPSVNEIIASDDHKEIRISDLDPIVSSDKNNYGLAVDIGTTTIALSLIDMCNGTEMYRVSGYNGQGIRGDDVLSRMEYSADGGTEELKGLVTDSVNILIGKEFPVNAVYISGNTVMTHLFLGIDPSPMRTPPYQPIVTEAEITGKESGLDVKEDARVLFMPSPVAYVGGDVVSGIVNSELDTGDELSLLIDIGTNGEVALGNRDIMLVCSSSAGPAFEGGTGSGMIAGPGAIDSFKIDDNGEFVFTVISGSKPKGICGSGFIDILAQLFLNGHIDKKGRFTDKAETETADGKKILRIAGDVHITENDIHDALMTKAAIYSASETLIRGLGVIMDDIGKIYIAGGFGNFINLDNAITMGMFPDVPRERFICLGNASLAGAKQALLSSSVRSRISNVFGRITYIDLGSEPVFSDEYMSALFFPHTDISRFPSYTGQ